MVVANKQGRAVRLEPGTAFSTGQRLDQPDNLTNETLQDLQIPIQDPAVVEAAAHADDVEAAYQQAAAIPPVPVLEEFEEDDRVNESGEHKLHCGDGERTENGHRCGADTDEVNIEHEALEFVAGLVAAKCKHLDPSMGLSTRETPPSCVPDSWIRTISRGGLVVPSPAWMNVVEAFEVVFQLVMGRDIGIVDRLTKLLLKKFSALDKRIARKLVTTRIHLRLRWLNQARAERAAARRAAKQVRQHVDSTM
ncbi:uncharacterized protein LOC119100224 [Pollicipes pollicipes]|nr:uncharacterized protein LOC119100224 [Pollicipes pollicipes]